MIKPSKDIASRSSWVVNKKSPLKDSMSTPSILQNLGRMLRESSTTTANFDALTRDLKKKLARGEEVTLTAKQLRPEVFVYSFNGGKLTEEEIEVKPASDIWQDNKDDSKTYISNAVYYAKPVKGGEKIEVTVIDGNQRKPFSMMSPADFEGAFTQMYPNKQADAEGYLQYRTTAEVEAVKYTEDTMKVNLGDSETVLNKGDYLVRKVDGNNFTYEVHKAKAFEDNYSEK